MTRDDSLEDNILDLSARRCTGHHRNRFCNNMVVRSIQGEPILDAGIDRSLDACMDIDALGTAGSSSMLLGPSI